MIKCTYKDKNYIDNTAKIVHFSDKYLGVGIRPSRPIWAAIKQTKRLNIENKQYKVVQELEIGDETWFVVTIV